MHATPLPTAARALYDELVELAMSLGADGHPGYTPGSVIRKVIKGAEYVYYQYRDLDGTTRHAYLGPDNPETRMRLARLTMRTAARASDLQRLDELRAAFVAVGGHVMEHALLRALLGFAHAGVLHPEFGQAVLVGTQAFQVLGNQLGVKWMGRIPGQNVRTSADNNLDLAVRDSGRAAPDLLTQLDRGFLPVPTLDPQSPLAFFSVRGQTLRVNLLAPPTGKPGTGPVSIPSLNAMARPLPYMDYLLQAPTPAVVVGRRALALVTVPAREHFALYTLLLSASHEGVLALQAENERHQAMLLLEVLIGQAPDRVANARRDLLRRDKGVTDLLKRALRQCQPVYPEAVGHLQGLE